MGKPRVIAETGAGQHGVATATVAARFGMECVVYMGSEDIERQAQNVFRMKLLGAEVVPVESGSKTLKDALNEAMRDWVTNVENTFYIIGTVAGPHPYPMMVRDFQSVIGEECLRADAGARRPAAGRRHRLRRRRLERDGHLLSVPRPSGGQARRRRGGGRGPGDRAGTPASLSAGRPGVLHGNRTYLLQNADGQIAATHSVSAGLDYPGVGPEHAWLKDSGRASYVAVTDDEALAAFHDLLPHRGHHPGARIEPRAGLRGAARADAAAERLCCWSIFPGAATRTWQPSPSARASSSIAAASAIRRAELECLPAARPGPYRHRPLPSCARQDVRRSFPTLPRAIRRPR